MFGSEGDKVAGRLRGGGNQPKASNKQTNNGEQSFFRIVLITFILCTYIL